MPRSQLQTHHYQRVLKIGDVTFLVKSDSIAIPETEQGAPYGDFEKYDDHSLSCTPDINVLIKTCSKNARISDDVNLLFTTDSSWSLYRKGDRFIIRFQPPGTEIPSWDAETNQDFSDVIVHMFQPSEAGDRLAEISYPLRYPLDQILLMLYLGKKAGLLIHSAGMIIKSKAYLFPGVSGAGKSTITSCLIDNEKFQVINDDRMIVRYDVESNTYLAFGTPWPGEAGIALNKSEILGGIFFLNKSQENRIEKISPQNAFEKLMPVSSIPWYHKEIVVQLFDFCEKLVSNVPAYNLFFTASTEIGKMIYDVTE